MTLHIAVADLAIQRLVRRPKVPSGHVVSCQSIAKRHDLNPRIRARWAALWVLGQLILKPTVAMAAKVFGVSIPLIVEERDHLLATTVPVPMIDHVWAAMSVVERELFVNDHLPELWNIFDQATAKAA